MEVVQAQLACRQESQAMGLWVPFARSSKGSFPSLEKALRGTLGQMGL